MRHMAASAGSQHRCVFVGNIPYDATEEQLIQICEEVGPVVSFRLVSDRETGKPKGYGFCEYKDEETALSARRNLQGYEINGRQLRVDFAENDKNADRNREQGRGGPGLASNSNADVQKQLNAAHTVGDSTLHQPMGFPLAATAASVMARALGGAQSANAQNLLQSQHGMGNDPLTPYLSRISRQQLHQIMLEMKALTTQNKTLARQLLQSNPQLAKALFQAQIMLDMVTPQMMQIASSSRTSISVPQLSSHLGQTSSQSLSGNLSRPPEHQLPSTSKNPGILQQATIPHQQVTIQPQYQLPPLHQSQVLQGTVADEPGHAMVSSRWSQSVGNLPAQPSLSTSKSLMPHSQSLPQLSVSTSAASLAHHPQLALPNMTSQQASLPQPLISQPGLSSGQLKVSTSLQVSNWPSGRNTQSIGSGLADQTLKRTHPSEMINYTSKSQRLEGGIQATQLVSSNSSGNSQTLGTGSVAGSKVLADSDQHSQKLQLPSEVESALLQQVLSLTPEQLSLLTPEQRQQVLQLQQMLSASK